MVGVEVQLCALEHRGKTARGCRGSGPDGRGGLEGRSGLEGRGGLQGPWSAGALGSGGARGSAGALGSGGACAGLQGPSARGARGSAGRAALPSGQGRPSADSHAVVTGFLRFQRLSHTAGPALFFHPQWISQITRGGPGSKALRGRGSWEGRRVRRPVPARSAIATLLHLRVVQTVLPVRVCSFNCKLHSSERIEGY